MLKSLYSIVLPFLIVLAYTNTSYTIFFSKSIYLSNMMHNKRTRAFIVRLLN